MSALIKMNDQARRTYQANCMSKSPTSVVLQMHGKNVDDYREIFLTAGTRDVSGALDRLASAAMAIDCEFVSEVSLDNRDGPGIFKQCNEQYSGMGLIRKK